MEFSGFVAVPVQRSIVVFAIVLAMGAHWAFLQSVAWTGMIISYSHQGSLRQALNKTFDGRHPCPLCKIVKEGEQSERKQEHRTAPLKLDLFVHSAAGQGVFPPLLEDLPVLRQAASSCFYEAPPVPPPIAA